MAEAGLWAMLGALPIKNHPRVIKAAAAHASLAIGLSCRKKQSKRRKGLLSLRWVSAMKIA